MNIYVDNFNKAVENYLVDLEIMGTSPRTLRNYRGRLSAFSEFYASLMPDSEPTVSIVKGWRDSLLARGLARNSVRQYLSELSFFFNAVSDETLGDARAYSSNPVSARLLPKQEKKPYDTLMSDEQAMLLWDMDNPKGARHSHFHPRNYAIVVLLLSSKIRNSELLALTPADLDFEYEEITIRHGKGDKYRVVDFDPIAQTAVKLYLASGLRPASATDNDPLFGTTAAHEYGAGGINGKNEEWHSGSSQWLSEVVRRHVLAVTGVDDIRTHDLRHLGSRLDLNSGMPLELLQSELGHASMNTTQVYSGRLMQKRHRKAAENVLAERDRQAGINMQRLSASLG